MAPKNSTRDFLMDCASTGNVTRTSLAFGGIRQNQNLFKWRNGIGWGIFCRLSSDTPNPAAWTRYSWWVLDPLERRKNPEKQFESLEVIRSIDFFPRFPTILRLFSYGFKIMTIFIHFPTGFVNFPLISETEGGETLGTFNHGPTLDTERDLGNPKMEFLGNSLVKPEMLNEFSKRFAEWFSETNSCRCGAFFEEPKNREVLIKSGFDLCNFFLKGHKQNVVIVEQPND